MEKSDFNQMENDHLNRLFDQNHNTFPVQDECPNCHRFSAGNLLCEDCRNLCDDL